MPRLKRNRPAPPRYRPPRWRPGCWPKAAAPRRANPAPAPRAGSGGGCCTPCNNWPPGPRAGGDLAEAITCFNRDHPILDVLAGAKPRRVGSSNGGEWASTAGCPKCGGGRDRLRIWPDHPRGPRAWCRRCNTSGDALTWAVVLAGGDPKRPGAVAAYLGFGRGK
ncbi:MAG: hypothetical protein HY719_14965 [Planctomycetes bacterium]|nr:hypothetical protein [Planctomycetota bacterium]